MGFVLRLNDKCKARHETIYDWTWIANHETIITLSHFLPMALCDITIWFLSLHLRGVDSSGWEMYQGKCYTERCIRLSCDDWYLEVGDINCPTAEVLEITLIFRDEEELGCAGKHWTSPQSWHRPDVHVT
jgi:hypothetical protein